MNGKLRLEEMMEFSSAGPVKRTVHRGDDFNVLVVCLDAGQEIPVHDESYNVFFYVVSGRGRFTLHGEGVDLGPGEMIYSPAGERGIVALERLCLLGVQEPH
ncbi:MAG: cupin domain-containing protein [Candidatus Bipolaricaulota bacterium]